MKILSANQIREADSFTIKNEPISSIDLMERAACKCFEWIEKHFSKKNRFGVIAGIGNNGGDGLVISRLLLESGFDVTTYIVWFGKKESNDFQINHRRLKKIANGIVYIKNEEEKFEFNNENVLVDAIFGTGLTREVTGLSALVIKKINSSDKKVISIDVPSGLIIDEPINLNGNVVVADYTLTFQVPKLSYFLPPFGEFCGNLEIIDIGLNQNFIDSFPSNYNYIQKEDIQIIRKKRLKFSHKGTFGHAKIIAGSKGMMGAALLSGKACIKSGPGLVTICSVPIGYQIIQSQLPEAMFYELNYSDVQKTVSNIGNFSAIGIGPGIGNNEESSTLLKLLIQNNFAPMVLDADAINILADNKTWLSFLPAQSILTPHVKEFERLTQKAKNGYERLEYQKAFSVKYNVFVILKGAYSSITCPDGKTYFNSTGNPRMATAGSGDVLTGIITGLMAQGYKSKESCIFGVYIHGLAGDIARESMGEESITAEEIIKNLGSSFLRLIKENEIESWR